MYQGLKRLPLIALYEIFAIFVANLLPPLMIKRPALLEVEVVAANQSSCFGRW